MKLIIIPTFRFFLRFWVLLFYLFFLFGKENVVAQEVINLYVTPVNKFNENFDHKVPVSGSAIVGIRLGYIEGNLDINKIRFPSFSGQALCVRALTQDGRFSMSNIYTTTNSIPPNAIVRISPVSLKYVDVLSSYDMDSFALKAFVSINGECIPARAIHLPQLLPNAKSNRTLTVFVNSGGRFSSMRIGEKGNKEACNTVTKGARIAYDTLCIKDVSGFSPGIINVDIAMDDGFGEEKVEFSLLIP